MADLGISPNFASKKEHVPETERFNQTIKERVRSDRSYMPLKRIYKLIIVHIFSTAIFWFVAFPLSKHGAVLCNTNLGGPTQNMSIFHIPSYPPNLSDHME